MLLEMAQKEEMQNKKLTMYENVIGFSTISFLILIFVTSFLVENNIAKIVLFILAFVLFNNRCFICIKNRNRNRLL